METGASREEKRWTVLKDLAGSSVIFSAVIAFTGFLSLRAHLNRLGAPVDLATPYAEYLAAGVRFITYLLLSTAFLVVYAIVPVVLVLFGVSWLRSRGKAVRMREFLRRPLIFYLYNGVALAILAVALLPFLKHLDQTGMLLSEPGQFSGAANSKRSYLMLQAICLFSLVVSWASLSINHGRRGGRILTALMLVLVAGQLLLLPVNYGILVIPADFPRVQEINGVAIQEPIFFLGSDTRGNRILYDRQRRTIAITPSEGVAITLGKNEGLLEDTNAP
ncbi:MAG: hypothetical protein ACJ76Y_18120 [Thermoanaerobaculia bacterium]